MSLDSELLTDPSPDLPRPPAAWPISTGAVRLTLAGEAVDLLAERALWWPSQGTLFVADVHLGKAATYRALGQPVPSGTTADNLSRLSSLIERLAVQRLVVLGDFLHAATAQQPSVLDPVHAWRERHAHVECLLVRGNHDSRAGDPPPSLRFAIVDEPHRLGPFAACHHPRRVPLAFALAGHLHPAVVLRGRADERLRLPCFCETPEMLILPAFGAFAGTTLEGLPRGARRHAVGGGVVMTVPGRAF